jgi:ATP synthase protein I
MGDDRSPTPREETDGDRKRLDDLATRLRTARKGAKPPARASTHREMGMAYRVLVEMIAGVGVGGFLGWWLDTWLETRPIFLMVMLVLGFAAGGMNAYRAIRTYNAGVARDTEDGA